MGYPYRARWASGCQSKATSTTSSVACFSSKSLNFPGLIAAQVSAPALRHSTKASLASSRRRSSIWLPGRASSEGPSWRLVRRVLQRVTSRSRLWVDTAIRASSGWVTDFRKAGMARFRSSAKTAIYCHSSQEERGMAFHKSAFCQAFSVMRKPSSAKCPKVRAVPLRIRAKRLSMRRITSISFGLSARPRLPATELANSLAAVSVGVSTGRSGTATERGLGRPAFRGVRVGATASERAVGLALVFIRATLLRWCIVCL